MTASAWRPRLRAEVERVAGPEGTVGLRQPRTGAVVKVGRVTRALLAALDGEGALDAVLDADGETALRALLLLGFIEGAGDANRRALLAVDESAPPLVFLEESRFTCHGSGQCCRTYVLGPIEPADVRRLEALPIASAFPELAGRPFVQEDDAGRLYLARRDDRCVFLLADGRCGIHARFGVESKPGLCRLYPWRAQLTVQGLRLVDTSECATFAASLRDGEPLREQLERIRPLLPSRPELHHPLALLDREHPCDYGWIVALEQDLLELVLGAPRPAEELLEAIAARALGFAEALARCPLAAGEPDATAAAFFQKPSAPLPPSSPREAGGGREGGALASVIHALRAAIEAKSLTQPVIPRFTKLLHEASSRTTFARPESFDAALRASFANAIFSGRLLCEGHLRAGLVRLALVALLSTAGGASERALSEAHMAANVALRMPSLGAALVPLGDLAPAVVREVVARLRSSRPAAA